MSLLAIGQEAENDYFQGIRKSLIQHDSTDVFLKSQKKWSVALSSLTLRPGMDDYLPRMYDPNCQLSILMLWWDLGGMLRLIPRTTAEYLRFQVPLAHDNLREMRQPALPLWPASHFQGLLNTRFYLLDAIQLKTEYCKIKTEIIKSDWYQCWQRLCENANESTIVAYQKARCPLASHDYFLLLRGAWLEQQLRASNTYETKVFQLHLAFKDYSF